MTGRTTERQFVVTYGRRPRTWCNFCDKAEAVGVDNGNGLIDPDRLAAAERDHRCGPRSSAWTVGDGR